MEEAGKLPLRRGQDDLSPQGHHSRCLGIESLGEEKRNDLRNVHDPLQVSRDGNSETLRMLEAAREKFRLEYFEKVSKSMLEGASRAFGLRPTPGMEEPSQSSGSAGPSQPSRPVGAASTQAMHRTIELHEVANLDFEKKEKAQELEECEDEEEVKKIEARIKEIDARKEELKAQIRASDQKNRDIKAAGGLQLTKDTVNDQSWHDARYHRAIKAGVSHSAACAQEKKRRKATLHRKEGGADRARERIRLDKEWHAEFDSKQVEESEYQDDTFGGVETEAVVDDGDGNLRVLKGKSKQLRRGEMKAKDAKTFVKSARRYRPLSQEEVSKFKAGTKEDEVKVMNKQRVNLHRMRVRKMTPMKKEQRKMRVKKARKRMIYGDEDTKFYLNSPHGGMMCLDFKRSFCRRGSKCKMGHSELDRELGFIEKRYVDVKKATENVRLAEKEEKEINSFDDSCNEQGSCQGWTKVVVNFDTGAAITAVPRNYARKGLVRGDDNTMSRSYKTASGELLEAEGGVTVKGYDNQGLGKSVDGRLVNVHRMLASGSAVARKNMVVLEENGGHIIPKHGRIAQGMREAFDKLARKYPNEAKQMTELYEHKGIYVFDLWLNGTACETGSGGGHQGLGAMEDEGFNQPAKP